MPLPSELLYRVLRTPMHMDVTGTPIVTTTILRDPANAAELVGALENPDSLESFNARRILCEFSADAVPSIATRLMSAGFNAREQGLDVLWALLMPQSPAKVRTVLQSIKPALNVLLSDKTPIPEDTSGRIEPDFSGRLCDQAYIRIQLMLSPRFNQSIFRGLDDNGRDREIDKLKRQDFGLARA
jgi:hypothetical protein